MQITEAEQLVQETLQIAGQMLTLEVKHFRQLHAHLADDQTEPKYQLLKFIGRFERLVEELANP